MVRPSGRATRRVERLNEWSKGMPGKRSDRVPKAVVRMARPRPQLVRKTLWPVVFVIQWAVGTYKHG